MYFGISRHIISPIWWLLCLFNTVTHSCFQLIMLLYFMVCWISSGEIFWRALAASPRRTPVHEIICSRNLALVFFFLFFWRVVFDYMRLIKTQIAKVFGEGESKNKVRTKVLSLLWWHSERSADSLCSINRKYLHHHFLGYIFFLCSIWLLLLVVL